MRLSQALKAKNKLAGDLALLKVTLLAQNSKPKTQPFDYDNHAIMNAIDAETDELISLKAGIAQANGPIYDKIFRLAELKGLVETITGLPTKAGVFKEHVGGYGNNPVEVEWIAQITKVQADTMLKDLRDKIDQIQGELDEYNFTHDVVIAPSSPLPAPSS